MNKADEQNKKIEKYMFKLFVIVPFVIFVMSIESIFYQLINYGHVNA